MAKVMLFVSSMHGGGAERVAALLANQWSVSGAKVTLVPTFSARGECVYPLAEAVELEFLADHVASQGVGLLSQISRLYALRQLIKATQPTVLVSFLSRVNVAVMLASWGLGIPIVVSERTYPPRASVGKLLGWLRAKLYRHANSVVMQTSKGLQWLTHTSPRARGVVIPNPVVYPVPLAQPELNPNDVLPAAAKIVLAVGRLTELKGYTDLLEGYAKLAPDHPNWHLVILGEGEFRPALTAKIEQLKLEGRVWLPGRVGNVATWYERADLFVLSSRYEGFPNALLEAMAHGVAVVSFACDTGPEDLITHGEDGLLVAPGEGAQGLYQAMHQLIEDDELRAGLALQAQGVQERYSVAGIAGQWQALFDPAD